jgi:zinc protease
VETLQRQGLLDCAGNHFRPDNLCFVVVGDIDHDEFAQNIDQHFSDMDTIQSTGELTRPDYPAELRKAVEQRDKQQTALAMAFRAPDFNDVDRSAMLVLQNIVSGLGGRFFEELRGRQSLAYTVSSYLISRSFGGAFLSYIATSPENEQRALDGLLQEFEKLITEPVAEQELRRAREYSIGTHEISLETYRAQMTRLAHYELLGPGAEAVAEVPARIRAVTREGILEAARKYFNPDAYAAGIVRGQ